MPRAGGRRLVSCENECRQRERERSEKIFRRAKAWYDYRGIWRIFCR
jgi:hypothetical protein